MMKKMFFLLFFAFLLPPLFADEKLKWSEPVNNKTFTEAVIYCSKLKENGVSDWQLPTTDELSSFNAGSGNYWSSDANEELNKNKQYANGEDKAWVYNFSTKKKTQSFVSTRLKVVCIKNVTAAVPGSNETHSAKQQLQNQIIQENAEIVNPDKISHSAEPQLQNQNIPQNENTKEGKTLPKKDKKLGISSGKIVYLLLFIILTLSIFRWIIINRKSRKLDEIKENNRQAIERAKEIKRIKEIEEKVEREKAQLEQRKREIKQEIENLREGNHGVNYARWIIETKERKGYFVETRESEAYFIITTTKEGNITFDLMDKYKKDRSQIDWKDLKGCFSNYSENLINAEMVTKPGILNENWTIKTQCVIVRCVR